MINETSAIAVAKSSFSKEFCKPLYHSYCFSRIPATIKQLLTGRRDAALPQDALGDSSKEYDRVILFFIDGFGWQFLEKYAPKYPFLRRFLEEGIATKLTAQFPSTTAGHVTCMNTGLSVEKSGVYEWFYYEPILDRMIAPLLFSFAGDQEIGSLQKTGVPPESLYPNTTFYQELAKEGISSHVMQHHSIAHSVYSQTMFKGAQNLPYENFSDALHTLSSLLSLKNSSKSYYYIYFGEIDSMGHRHGINSEKFELAIERCWRALEEIFWEFLYGKSKKTACLIIADHGMISVDPKTTLYLNKEIPEILPLLKRNRQGELLAPAGSCRDFFLHVEENALQEAQKKLSEFLQGRAEVYLTRELLDLQLFGEEKPSQAFLKRVGNLVILPYTHHSIWWYEKHRFEQHFYAAHGGLTREEMETPFLFIDL